MNKYQVEKKIGKGSYGNVYICRAKVDGKRYVLKKIPLDNMSSKEKHSTRQEVALLQSLQHPNIVGYKDSFMTNNDKELCIVMTYCEGGDLSSKIKEYKYKKIPEKLIMKWFAQLLLAVEFLHSRKVLHRDLKSQNIFLTKDGTVKLGDFGIARVFERTLDMAKTSIGTPLYMSPEVCNNRPYNYKSDVWSLGCILYELCARKPPFNARDLRGLFVKIIRGVYSPIPYTYSTKLQDLVRKTLYTNPHRRPSISQILKSAYVKKCAQSYIRSALSDSSSPIENADPNRLRHTIVMERREISNIKIQAAELGYNLDAIMQKVKSANSSSSESKSSHKKGSSDNESEHGSVHSSHHSHHRHHSHHSHHSHHPSHPRRPSQQSNKEDVVLNKRKIPLKDVKRAVAKLNKMEQEQQRVKAALEKLKKEKLDRQSRLARANEIRRNALSQKKRAQDDAILQKQRRKQKAAEERRRRIKKGLMQPPRYGSRARNPSSNRSRSSNKTPPKSQVSAAPDSARGKKPEDYKKRYNKIRESKQELDQYVEKRKQMEKQIQNIEQELHDMASRGGRHGGGAAKRPSVHSGKDDYREHIKKMAKADHIPSHQQMKDELSGLSHRDRILKMKEMKKRAEEAEKQNMLQQARREYHSNRVRAQRMQYNQYHGSSPPKGRPSAAGDDIQDMLPQQDRYEQNEQFIKQQQHAGAKRPSAHSPEHGDDDDDDSEENELIEEMERAYTTQKKQLHELRKTITQAYGKSINDLQMLASKDDEPDSEEDDLESDDESESSDDEQYEEMHELVQPGRLSDRIDHLKQLCVKYLGESNFKHLYRVMRDGSLPQDDRAREEQLSKMIGPHKMEYVSLVDELLFTEDSLA